MTSRARCLLLATVIALPLHAFDVDDLVKEYAGKLRKARSTQDRVDAAEWLGGRDQPLAIEALAAALSDKEVQVRIAAASALWRTGEKAAAARPALLGALEDADARVVVNAAGALQMMDASTADLAGPRRRALQDAREADTAFLAARGLIGFEGPETLLLPIVSYLEEQGALASQGGSATSDHKDNAGMAREALEDLLHDSRGSDAVPGLAKLVQRHAPAAPAILRAVGTMSPVPDAALDMAMSQMSSRDPAAREAALSLASKMKKEPQVTRWAPAAIRLLSDGDENVRNAAVWSMRDAAGLAHAAAPELARILREDPSRGVRAQAAKALEEVGDASQAIPQDAKAAVAAAVKVELVEAMASRDEDLAEAAVGAYNVLYLPSDEIVSALMDAAERNASARVRYSALLCLRNREGQALAVIDRLRPLASGPDARVAEDARTAIEWIERGGRGTPEPIKTGAASRSSLPAAAAGRGASPPPRTAEGAALAKLRSLGLAFDEHGFERALLDGNVDAIVAYVDAGMSPDVRFASDNQRSPLMVAFFFKEVCRSGHGAELVKAFVERGADLNQVDENGNTALMFAADTCDAKTIKLLLDSGARRDARNQGGLTALEMGLPSGNPGVEALIAAGARLEPAKVKGYLDAYKDNPDVVALVKKASRR